MFYKKLSDIAVIKFCTMSPSRAKEQVDPIKWLPCANFLADNTVIEKTTESNNAADDDWLLKKDDIVLKRIAPMFVNYIDWLPEDIYCGNNLIIISALDQVYPRYLAMQLNDIVKELSTSSSVGAVMKSISRTDLENVKIPVPNYEKQVLIGDLWYDSVELKKKKTRLLELENMRNAYLLNKYILSLSEVMNNG